MKTLIIAEKPSVARDIAAALGGCKPTMGWLESDTAIVTSAIGHLVEIYTPEADVKGAILPIIPAGGFELRPIERTKNQYKLIKQLLARKDVVTVVNACDAGREGELIFRLIVDLAGNKKPVRRLWLQSMTREAILSALNNTKPSNEYDGLGDAAKCRNEADWLTGINGSRAVSRAKGLMMSVGRVQTPTLSMVVKRHLEITNFSAKDYYELHGHFEIASGTYTGKWQNPNANEGEPAERCDDIEIARAIQAKCDGQDPTAITETSCPVSKQAPKLFDLTSLQRSCNEKFSLSAKQTLDIAQSLYEKHKALTYPRTDSTCLPDDYLNTATETLQSLSVGPFKAHSDRVIENDWVKPNKRIFDSAKITDHFAIIPTGKIPNGMSEGEKAVFEMVVKRFIAAFHPAAQSMSTTRITVVADEKFKSTGSVLVSPGWLEIYGPSLSHEDNEEKEPALCRYQDGEQATTQSMDMKALKTKPPKQYTEATLLQAMATAGRTVDDEELAEAMKESGLGTPATRASIIETLVCDTDGKGQPKEPYIRRDKKNLIPTAKGIDLVAYLNDAGITSLTSAATTGAWELRLAQMIKGEYFRPKFMEEIEAMTRDMVSKIGTQPSGELMKAACPKCKGPLMSGPRTVKCQAACGFELWREIAKRPMSLSEIEELISTGVHAPLQGFISSKTGNPFSAGLKINEEFKAAFVFSESPMPAGNKLTYKCPRCKQGLLSNAKVISCESTQCGFKLWKTVASRPITDSEAKKLIAKGLLGPLNGFVSAKSGKHFSASIKLNSEFKTEFVFE